MVIEIVFSSLLIELVYVSLQLISSSVCYIQFLMFVLAILSKLDKEFLTNGMYVFTTWMHRKWNGFNTHQKTCLNKEEKCKTRLAINLKWTNKTFKAMICNKQTEPETEVRTKLCSSFITIASKRLRINYGLVYKLHIPDSFRLAYLLTTYIYKNRYFFFHFWEESFFWQMLRDQSR